MAGTGAKLEINVQVQGLDAVVAKIGDPIRRHVAVLNFLRVAGVAVQRNVMREEPVRTGTMRRSTTSRVEDGVVPKAIVGVNVNYGAFVQFGTAPHIIRAVNARALMIPVHPGAGTAGHEGSPFGGVVGSKKSGVKGTISLAGRPLDGAQVSFFSQVHHPGTKPNPFLTRGLDKSIPEIHAGLAVLAKQIVGGMSEKSA